MPNLNEGIILSFALLLPPISDQAVIASLLGALDDKIALNRRMAQTLEATARALFRSWFVDFDPVRAKAEGRETGLDAETAAAFPDAFGEDGLPVGWRTELAGTLFEIAIGRTPPRVEQHWFSSDPSDVPWISIRDLGASGTYISKSNEYLTRDAVRQFRVKTISIGTVVLSFKLTVGRVAIASREMVSNEAIAQFTPLEKTHFGSEYLYCFLKAFDFNSLGSTSSIANAVNSDSIRRIPILVPSKEIHRAFCGSVDSIFKRLKCVQDEIGSLAAIRDTLLPRLISGELRIADAEKKIEAA